MVPDRFNPRMLKLAREWKGETQATLAAAAGVTQALVSKMESGLIQHPSEHAVANLANALRVPPSFFYQEERVTGLPDFHYRKRKKLGAKPLAQIEAVINIRRIHVEKLLRSYEVEVARPIPQIDLDEQGLTPEKAAERVREHWMVPRGPIDNVTDLVEEAGGIVIHARFGTALLDGLSFRLQGLPPLFFMNKDAPGDRYRFSLAHELGHIVLHHLPGDDDMREAEADRFAAAFLMPAKEIRPYLKAPKLGSLSRVKAYWKVSIASLIRRAHDIKLITPSQYKSLNIQYRKHYRDEEPQHIPIEKPWRLERIVRYHLDTLGYSVAELAELLCLPSADVERHYLGRSQSGLRLVVSN